MLTPEEMLREKIDLVVRRLRSNKPTYQERMELNERLDQLCDVLEAIVVCGYCGEVGRACTCPF